MSYSAGVLGHIRTSHSNSNEYNFVYVGITPQYECLTIRAAHNDDSHLVFVRSSLYCIQHNSYMTKVIKGQVKTRVRHGCIIHMFYTVLLWFCQLLKMVSSFVLIQGQVVVHHRQCVLELWHGVHMNMSFLFMHATCHRSRFATQRPNSNSSQITVILPLLPEEV